MKKIFALVVVIALAGACQAQVYDSIAIKILDRMTDIIGDLSSCKYTLSISKDVEDFDYGKVTRYNTHEVYLAGPDKMLVDSRGDNGHKEFWYNGSKIVFYNFDENNFADLDAPATILATIDTVHKLYGIDFPAADFIYPAFTDDLMGNSDKITFAGLSEVDGKECFHIIADGKEMNMQFWISNDATMMPQKMVIIHKSKSKTLRYEADFSEWQLNPVLPASMFDFLPPANASRVTMLPQ